MGMTKHNTDWLVAIDMGSAHVKVAVAKWETQSQTAQSKVVLHNSNHAFQLMGLGTNPSQGIKAGVVVDIEQATQSLRKALAEVQHFVPVDLSNVGAYVGITGEHLQCRNSNGVVALDGHDVSDTDVKIVLRTAAAVKIPAEQNILSIELQEFILDQIKVDDPVGMTGVRLQSNVHVVMGLGTLAEHLKKTVHRSGIDIAQLKTSANASGSAVLTTEEKERGVLILDIGAGTTDVALYQGGAVRYSACLPIGGHFITSDIAATFGIGLMDAEALKIKHGIVGGQGQNQMLQIVPIDGQMEEKITQQQLSTCITERLQETFNLVLENLRSAQTLQNLPPTALSSVVITGGTANLTGMSDAAKAFFQVAVRCACPLYKGNLYDAVAQPQNATVMGLLEDANADKNRQHKVNQHKNPTKLRTVWQKINRLLGNKL